MPGTQQPGDWISRRDPGPEHVVRADELASPVVDCEYGEAERRQSQKLELVGQLAAGVAHDFNNHLTGIVGSLDLLQRRMSEGRADTFERYLAIAMTSANRAAALSQKLLSFCRVEPIAQELVELNSVIAGIEELVRGATPKTIELERVAPAEVWQPLCERSQLESAVLNLALNARDAMVDGGRLILETGNVVIDRAAAMELAVDAGEYVFIAVKDTGCGMPADVLGHIFEPFYTTKPSGVGTGLGMPMVRRFARQSGGAISIRSKVGFGSEVRIYLPRACGETPTPLPPNVLPARKLGVAKNILVIEDEQSVRALIMEVLQDAGFRAIAATDAATGLAILDSALSVDLLITDLGLPGLGGAELVRAARLRRPALKVLFMTGHEGGANGAVLSEHDVMAKPFTIDGLLARIHAHLDEQRGPSPAGPARQPNDARDDEAVAVSG